jgi:hypothetical protein
VLGMVQSISTGAVDWVKLMLGGAHVAIAVVASLAWQRVRRGPTYYVVSDPFRSERIGFGEVCLMVNAPGLMWNRTRMHLVRPCRFGWSVTFVPESIMLTRGAH